MRAQPLARLCGACAIAVATAGCTTPLERGEREYQEGDRAQAIAVWEKIDAAELDYASARGRIDAVAEERGQLIERYLQRGRYFEERGRLAEAVLDYRLALRIEPNDRATLAHVQELSRRVARARAEGLALFRAAFARDDLAAARVHVSSLRVLDAFSPEVADCQRQLAEALATRIQASLARANDRLDAGRFPEAESAFRSVLELDPQNVTARGNLAYIERLRAESAPAHSGAAPGPDPSADDIAPRRRARAGRPNDAEIRAEGYFQNALNAEASGDPLQAIRYDLAALDSDASHASARGHLGALRRALGGRVPSLLESGRQHFQREDLRAALDQWDLVLLIDPGNAEARDYTARAQKLLERLEEMGAALPPATAKP